MNNTNNFDRSNKNDCGQILPTLSGSPRGMMQRSESFTKRLLKLKDDENDEVVSRIGDMSLSSGKTSQESELLSLHTGKSSISTKSQNDNSFNKSKQNIRSSIIEEDRQIRDKFYGVKFSEEVAAAKEQFVDPFTQQYRPYAGRRRRRLTGNAPEDPRLGPGFASVFRGSTMAIAGAAAAVAAARSDIENNVNGELSSASIDSLSIGPSAPVPAKHQWEHLELPQQPRSLDRPSSAHSSVYSCSTTRSARHMVERNMPFSPGHSVISESPNKEEKGQARYNEMITSPINSPLPAVDVLGGGKLVDKRSVTAALRKGKQSADSYSYSPDCPRRTGPGAAVYSIENATDLC